MCCRRRMSIKVSGPVITRNFLRRPWGRPSRMKGKNFQVCFTVRPMKRTTPVPVCHIREPTPTCLVSTMPVMEPTAISRSKKDIPAENSSPGCRLCAGTHPRRLFMRNPGVIFMPMAAPGCFMMPRVFHWGRTVRIPGAEHKSGLRGTWCVKTPFRA